MSSSYPSDWDSRRQSVYKRDGYTCQNCGIQGGPHGSAELHAHHVVPKSRGGTHDRSNLISLCDECHRSVHNKNTNAPTHYQEHEQTIEYSDPDFGELVDVVTDDTEVIVSTAGDLLLETNQRLSDGDLDFQEILDVENELRIAIISTLENVDLLQTASTKGYSPELVHTAENTVDEAEELLTTVMDTLNLVEECIFDLVDQATSCPHCGTTLNSSDKFCGGCGADLGDMVPSCPQCGSEFSEEDDFCRGCGFELSDHQGPTLGSAELKQDWVNRMESNIEELDSAIDQYVISEIKMDIKLRIESELTTNVVWDNCPSCGFPEAALRTLSGIECVVCEGEWKDKGILNREIKMTRGDERGRSMPKSEWEPTGEKRNEEERYKDVLFPTSHFAE